MKMTESNKLARFGFDFKQAGAHTSRTIMIDELEVLLSYLDTTNAHKTDYLNAIDNENCLSKRTQTNRKLTYRDLVKLYTLESSFVVFRALLYFWLRDQQAHPLLAILCGYCRDSLLRLTSSFILSFSEGAVVNRKMLEEFIEHLQPGRFSPATLKSTTQNINSSWTQSGHLKGHSQKSRTYANATPGSVAYALFLGYLTGVRGESLFQTEFTKLLDCSIEHAIGLAEEASRRGWIVFKRIGKTIEVLFPSLLTQQEMEWIREQS
jgi:hypothetical protein